MACMLSFSSFADQLHYSCFEGLCLSVVQSQQTLLQPVQQQQQQLLQLQQQQQNQQLHAVPQQRIAQLVR
jgi:hypothetical protein